VIRVIKSPAPPRQLAAGLAETAANCRRYDADPAAYQIGAARFSFKERIYGAAAVKTQLKADQHDKCCFCEAIFDANVAGDVEHYRPKGRVEAESGPLLPGYYWLAYEWMNLHYACPDCNEYRKRDRFPLRDEAQRARDHHGDAAAEQPLLLDPAADNPRDHIIFKGEAPIGPTPRGDATIDLLRLDRAGLARDRLRHLRHLSRLRESVELLAEDPRPEAIDYVARTRAELEAAPLPGALFSAAVVDHLTALERGVSYLPD
jgi:uncharacterized protein (TIGR02646 family)